MAQIIFPLFDSPEPRPPQPAAHLEPRTSNLASRNLILTPVDSPRAASLDALLAAAHALSIPAHPAASPAEALALARSLTPPSGLILATGSVYLIGALRELATESHA
jgi:dihydrofolate synthase/folylpolyglutamate synthase